MMKFNLKIYINFKKWKKTFFPVQPPSKKMMKKMKLNLYINEDNEKILWEKSK